MDVRNLLNGIRFVLNADKARNNRLRHEVAFEEAAEAHERRFYER